MNMLQDFVLISKSETKCAIYDGQSSFVTVGRCISANYCEWCLFPLVSVYNLVRGDCPEAFQELPSGASLASVET